jgi:hypothetical protein
MAVPSSNFDGDILFRVKFGDHGITTGVMVGKRITREDGSLALILRNEWFKMIPPLVTSPDGEQWYIGGVPVEIVPASREAITGRNRRNARRNVRIRESDGFDVHPV